MAVPHDDRALPPCLRELGDVSARVASESESTNSAASDRVRVRANAAIRTPQTLHFGKLVWVEGTRLLIQLEHPLTANDPVDLRVDLSPLPGTALARGTVVRELARVEGELPKYLVRLVEVALDDRQRWLAWLEEKRSGGTLSHVSDLTAREGPLQSGYAKVAEIERAAALDRMKARTNPSSSPSSSASWITSDVREAASGRAAMRDALKSAIRKTAENEPPGRVVATSHLPPRPLPSQAAVDRTTSVAPVQRPIVGYPPPIPAPIVVPALVRPADPTWNATSVKGNTYVEVKWSSAEAFSYDVHSQLLALTLTLQSAAHPFPQTPPIHMFLRHDPVMIQCEATMLSAHPDHASYNLALSPVHIAELRRFSRPLSVDQSMAVERSRRR